jgi:Acyltransferase family
MSQTCQTQTSTNCVSRLQRWRTPTTFERPVEPHGHHWPKGKAEARPRLTRTFFRYRCHRNRASNKITGASVAPSAFLDYHSDLNCVEADPPQEFFVWIKVLSQREHYTALDGLRGFAAISVVLFHIGHWLDAPLLAANSGLAVDFFFCLSGFVLALAYDRRFRAGLSNFQFIRIRLIRLMPLTILGNNYQRALRIVSRLYIQKPDFGRRIGLGHLSRVDQHSVAYSV